MERAVSSYGQGKKSAEKLIALIDKYQGCENMTNTMLNERGNHFCGTDLPLAISIVYRNCNRQFYCITTCLFFVQKVLWKLSIADQIFVGNGVGYQGNAATGIIFPITVVGWGLSLFFGDGAAAALSVSLGGGETEDIHRSVGGAVLGSFFSSVVVIIIAYLWGDSLLQLIGATDANIQMVHDYGVIIFAKDAFCYDAEYAGFYYPGGRQPGSRPKKYCAF